MRKPDFCLGENKREDQLRGNREADHVEKVSSVRLIVLAAEGISGTGKSSSVLSGDL